MSYPKLVAATLVEAAKLAALSFPTTAEETENAAEELHEHVVKAVKDKAIELGYTPGGAEATAYAIAASLVISRAINPTFSTKHVAEYVGRPLTEKEEAEVEKLQKLQRSIGERCRRLRRSARMTMGTVAVAVDATVTEISNVERGLATTHLTARVYNHLILCALEGVTQEEGQEVVEALKKRGGIQLSRKYRNVALMPEGGLFKALKKHLPEEYAEVQRQTREFAKERATAAFGANPRVLDVRTLSEAEWAEWEAMKKAKEAFSREAYDAFARLRNAR